jgi:hypothetical protein
LDTNDPLVDTEAVEEEDDALPDVCPPYVSDWGWLQLQAYFNQEGVFYEPSWLAALFKPTGYAPRWEAWYEEVAPQRKQHVRASRQAHNRASKSGLLAPSFSDHPPPPCPGWYRTLNDVVILNQVRAVSTPDTQNRLLGGGIWRLRLPGTRFLVERARGAAPSTLFCH